ncbi:MAG: sterol desaturase family protein [Saprospiraceae bacterium]
MKQKLFISNKEMPEGTMEKEVFPGFYILKPIIPFLVFSPITIGMILLSVLYVKMLWWQILLGFGSAFVFWTVFEYMMHRYLFHWEPKSAFWQKFIYTIHQGHHDYPNDNRLMLVGPVVSVPAFLMIWGIAFLIVGHYTHPFMAGMATCYMFYDWLHFASHNENYKNTWFQMMKSHHMRHHYEDNDKNFAFTTLIWDIIMQTLLRTTKRKTSAALRENTTKHKQQ